MSAIYKYRTLSYSIFCSSVDIQERNADQSEVGNPPCGIAAGLPTWEGALCLATVARSGCASSLRHRLALYFMFLLNAVQWFETCIGFVRSQSSIRYTKKKKDSKCFAVLAKQRQQTQNPLLHRHFFLGVLNNLLNN